MIGASQLRKGGILQPSRQYVCSMRLLLRPEYFRQVNPRNVTADGLGRSVCLRKTDYETYSRAGQRRIGFEIGVGS
jgi:hypothetical protein